MATTETIKKYNLENISFLGKEVETNKKIRIKSIDFEKQKIIGENRTKEIKEYNFSEVRLLAYTRMRDVNKRKIYEGSYISITRNKEHYKGIVIFRNAWGIMNYKTNKFTKILKMDILKKIIKK